MKQRILKLVAACLLLTSISTSANAVVVVNLWEQGGNVEAQAKGTLDITGLIFGASNISYPDDFRIQPNGAEVLFFGLGELYRSPVSAPNFGSGSIVVESLQSEGDHFGWERFNIVTPIGFVSGGSIFSTGRIISSTLVGLGAISGTYNWVLPNDTISLIVGTAPTAVPVPAAFPLFTGGLGLLGLLGWHRNRKAARAAGQISNHAAIQHGRTPGFQTLPPATPL